MGWWVVVGGWLRAGAPVTDHDQQVDDVDIPIAVEVGVAVAGASPLIEHGEQIQHADHAVMIVRVISDWIVRSFRLFTISIANARLHLGRVACGMQASQDSIKLLFMLTNVVMLKNNIVDAAVCRVGQIGEYVILTTFAVDLQQIDGI